MKKSFMNNIKHFVDSNVRQRIDRVANNNNDFFGDDLLLVERQFEDIRHVCIGAEKRISALLLSLNQSTPTLGAYSQNTHLYISNLSSNLSTTANCNSATTILGNEAQASSLYSTTNIVPSSDKQSSSRSSTIAKQSHSIPDSQLTGSSSTNTTNTSTNISQPSLLLLAGSSSSNNTSCNPNEATEFQQNDIRRFKKLPIIGFLKFLVKSRSKSKPGSLLTVTLTHCSQLQTQLTQLYLNYERTIESQCLRPLRQILEIDVPNIVKLRKLFIKSHNDLESVKSKYNGASLKQQQSQTSHFTSTSYTIQQSIAQHSNINKLDQLKKELDEAVTRFEQAGDNYATELYTFVCRETELVNLFIKFYQHQAEYQLQVSEAISNSLPTLSNILATTPRKAVFGTPLEEHLRSTGRSVALIIELCIHLLHSKALNEEGLFRIPGSSAKIKKLKSAIDAWFVTLASQNELNNNLQSCTNSSSKFKGSKSTPSAIHNLFKDIVGQRSAQNFILTNHANSEALPVKSTGTTTAITTRDDSTLTQSSTLATTSTTTTTTTTTFTSTTPIATSTPTPISTITTAGLDHQYLVYDVHTIAGLLKLYLRELPEPLFTYALYQQWIDAAVDSANSKQNIAFEQVIQQLPEAYYNNLRFLMRFLQSLTLYSDCNKMTATNLAITMAPSLIWAPPNTNNHLSSSSDLSSATRDQQPSSSINSTYDYQQPQEDLQTLNLQISNVGISASLHALVIENIINHAELLFPGTFDFRIPDLDEISTFSTATAHLSNINHHKQDRSFKSSSPTGLSTASSSSFASSSNGSATSSSTSKTHSRRGGSMDGLLDGDIKVQEQQRQTRPASVHIQHSLSQPVPPPKPPAPVSRSHLRHSKEIVFSHLSRHLSSPHSVKPPAPPLPPPSSFHHQRQQVKPTPTTANVKPLSISTDSTAVPPVPTSCRGTGVIGAAPSPTLAMRPSVPPPNRPVLVCSRDSGSDQVDSCLPAIEATSAGTKVTAMSADEIDSRSSNNSVASSGNLRTDFEEVSAVDVDDIDISVPSVSPVVSFDSLSDTEDVLEDFNNDELRSLERSWTECNLDRDQDNVANTTKSTSKIDKEKKNLLVVHSDRNRPESSSTTSSPTSEPPIKPPRCISPKVTQSTPL